MIRISDDFILFVFAGIDELLHKYSEFFHQEIQNNKYETPLNYIEFLKSISALDEINQFQQDGSKLDDLNSIYNLFNAEQFTNLLSYFNEHSRGYDYQGSMDLDLNSEDLENEFEYYIKLKKQFPYLHISYFRSLVNSIHSNKFETQIINSLKHYIINSQDDIPKTSLQNYLLEKSKTDLYEAYYNCRPQLNYIFDEDGKYAINEYKSIQNFCSSITYDYQYSYSHKMDINLINFSFFKYHLINNFDLPVSEDTDYEYNIEEDFLKIKAKNKDLISFLRSKDFNNTIIDNIFNQLCQNKYHELNNIHYEKSSMVNLFRVIFSFHIIDFYQSVGEDITKDAFYQEKILEFHPSNEVKYYQATELGKYYRLYLEKNKENKNYCLTESKMKKFYRNLENKYSKSILAKLKMIE